MLQPHGKSLKAFCKKINFWITKLDEDNEEANNKINLNLNERIIQEIFCGEVHNVKKTIKKINSCTDLLINENEMKIVKEEPGSCVFINLTRNFEKLSFENKNGYVRLFSVLTNENFCNFNNFFQRHHNEIIQVFLKKLNEINNMNQLGNEESNKVNILTKILELTLKYKVSWEIYVNIGLLNLLSKINDKANDVNINLSIVGFYDKMFRSDIFSEYYDPTVNSEKYQKLITFIIFELTDDSKNYIKIAQFLNILYDMLLYRKNVEIMKKIMINVMVYWRL